MVNRVEIVIVHCVNPIIEDCLKTIDVVESDLLSSFRNA